MPASKTPSAPRRAYLKPDDLLVRLISLPEREQETVLAILADAVDNAETAVVTRQSLIFDARTAAKRTVQPAVS